MNIRNFTSKKIERPKSRVEVQHRGTSVFRHRSSIQISKGKKASGVIADNHESKNIPLFSLKKFKRDLETIVLFIQKIANWIC
jgi:hypothetical protein